MANPSPLCEVKVGAAAYVTTVGGVDMSLSDTVIIRLASQADVDSWLIECATTDDTSDAATVTASLSIDSVNKTATFTAPADGKAYRFRSRVNGGFDRNGIARPSYTTTFCLYTPIYGRRVVATDETTEGDATFGWVKWINDLIRTPADASLQPGGSSGQVQYNGGGGSFMGATGLTYNSTTHLTAIRISVASIAAAAIAQATLATGCAIVAPELLGARVSGVATMSAARIGTAIADSLNVGGTATLTAAMVAQATLTSVALVGGTGATGVHHVRPTIHSPIIGGTMVFTGMDQVANGLSDHVPVSAVRVLSTTDATVSPIFAFKPPDEAVTTVIVEVNAVPSGGAGGGSYARRAAIWMNGGVGTCGTVEESWSREFTASAIGFTGIGASGGSGIHIGVSGATGFINIKGTPTGRIKWGATVSYTTTSWA